jgi:hypothetical protein
MVSSNPAGALISEHPHHEEIGHDKGDQPRRAAYPDESKRADLPGDALQPAETAGRIGAEQRPHRHHHARFPLKADSDIGFARSAVNTKLFPIDNLPKPAISCPPMTLHDWLQSHDLSQKAFAKTIGIARGHLCYLIKGERLPGARIALRIKRATDGAVDLEDWCPDEEVAE